jgi:hypothetical protein
MKNLVTWSILIICTCTVPAFAQNKVIFDNQSGDPALVKLIGPTQTEVVVPNRAKVVADAAAGRYLIKVRYDTRGKYHYSKGQEFEVKETATTRSETTITLHKVTAGNYDSRPISKGEFDESSASGVSTPHATNSVVTIPRTEGIPTIAEAQAFFDRYVDLERNYDTNAVGMYADQAIIENISGTNVNYTTGSQYKATMPFFMRAKKIGASGSPTTTFTHVSYSVTKNGVLVTTQVESTLFNFKKATFLIGKQKGSLTILQSTRE